MHHHAKLKHQQTSQEKRLKEFSLRHGRPFPLQCQGKLYNLRENSLIFIIDPFPKSNLFVSKGGLQEGILHLHLLSKNY